MRGKDVLDKMQQRGRKEKPSIGKSAKRSSEAAGYLHTSWPNAFPELA